MKYVRLVLISTFLLCLCLGSFNTPYACTAFILKSNEGVVTGRTLDYSKPSIFDVKTYIKGTIITSVLGKDSWKVLYDFVTINNVLPPDNYLVAFEGMNKEGISISGNLADAVYPQNVHGPTLSTDDIVRYILSCASNINDVRKLFASINISSKWKYHYIVFDKSGKSLVIEFKGGAANFYENATKVLTNNPDFDYHIANLNNYANLRNYNPQSITPDTGTQFHGAGMYGLPGDWMSPSRFIRGHIMIKEGEKHLLTQIDAINLASRIIDSVSLIKGIDLGKSESSDPIYTQIQIIKDISNSRIYLKRYDEFQWTVTTY